MVMAFTGSTGRRDTESRAGVRRSASSRTMTAVGTLLFTVFLPECGGDRALNLPDDVLWESDHFRYHSRSGEVAACERVTEQLERHFATVREYLGFPWPARSKVDYYKFRDQNDYERESACPESGSSCVRDGVVLTASVLQHHELIHAYLARVGLPPAFFTEGVAVALACRHPFRIDPRPWRDVVAVPFGNTRAFLEGPWFVAYLLRRYGPEPFLMLYASLPTDASAERIAATFATVYEVSLDSAWEDAERAGKGVACLFLWECAGPPLTTDGTEHSIGQACDASDGYRTFELAAPQDLVMTGSSYPIGAPVSCDVAPARPFSDDPSLWVANVSHYTAGRYFVGASDVPSSVSLRPVPGPVFGAECSEARTLDLSGSAFEYSHFELTLPAHAGPLFVRLEPAAGQALCSGGEHPALAIDACPDCDEENCAPPSCPAAVDTARSVALRLTPAAPADINLSAHFLQVPTQ
jgi:hypothetical protein